VRMFRRKMALEKVLGRLGKVAMGSREREKEGINKLSCQMRFLAFARVGQFRLSSEENKLTVMRYIPICRLFA